MTLRPRSSSRPLGLLLAAVLLAGCGTTTTTTTKEGPVTTKDGFSLLTDAGVARIKDSRSARFDLRDRVLTRADVGLDGDRLGPQVGAPGKPELDLELLGPDGTERVRTSTFMVSFLRTDGPADSVTWFESYATRAEGDAALGEAVEHWGLPRDTVDNWQETVKLSSAEDTSTSTVRTSYGPGLGTAGLVAEVTVRTEPDHEGETLEYEVYLAEKYYTEQSLEKLRGLRR